LQSQYKSVSQQSLQYFIINVVLPGRFQMFNESYEQNILGAGVYLPLVRPSTWTVRCPYITTQIAIIVLMHRYLIPMAAYKGPWILYRFVESEYPQTTWDTHLHKRLRHLLAYCRQSIQRQL